MSSFKTIPLKDIHVPKRLRDVDDDHALAIQTSIVQHGLLNPVTVRSTPNGKAPYTLVAGAHRFRAIELLEDAEIDTIVVKADQLGAVLLEIEENLFRNDLSVMDRAVFVQTYRDTWEKKHGKITRGGDQTVKLTVCPVDVLAENAERGFAEACANRLGVSKASVERLQRIATNLPAAVRKSIVGTPIADNQSQLLKLAKLPPEQRKKASVAIRESGGDFKAAMALLEPPAKKPDPQMQVLSRLIDSWERAKPATRQRFMDHAKLAAVAKEAEAG
jgi:ParB family chromosome partitioning protein